MNSDGRPDIIVNNQSPTLSVLTDLGNGSFTGQAYNIVPIPPTIGSLGASPSPTPAGTPISLAATTVADVNPGGSMSRA